MATPKNERKTENIVRDQLRALGYYRKGIAVEEQRSEIEAVKRLLRAASKAGHGGIGAPEFIISATSDPDFLIIIECKADPRDHISDVCRAILAGQPVPDEDDEQYVKRVQRYGMDGALHYASRLSKDFNVVAVAVSGDTSGTSRVHTVLYPKGASGPQLLRTKDGKAIERLIPWPDYIEHGTFDPTVQRLRAEELMAFSRELHDFMRDHAKLTESEKPLLVSGH